MISVYLSVFACVSLKRENFTTVQPKAKANFLNALIPTAVHMQKYKHEYTQAAGACNIIMMRDHGLNSLAMPAEVKRVIYFRNACGITLI